MAHSANPGATHTQLGGAISYSASTGFSAPSYERQPRKSTKGSGDCLSANRRDRFENLSLDELEWRFNNRDNPYLFRDTLLKLIKSENLPYQELTENKL